MTARARTSEARSTCLTVADRQVKQSYVNTKGHGRHAMSMHAHASAAAPPEQRY